MGNSKTKAMQMEKSKLFQYEMWKNVAQFQLSDLTAYVKK